MQKLLRSPRAPKLLVCLFFVCFLLLGLVTAGDYGQPWDELDELDILRMNLWQYARAVGADESVFQQWTQPNELSLNQLTPIAQSVERDHGQSAFYPLAGIALDTSVSPATRQLVWHMYCWALFTLGACALYGCCRQLGLSRFFSLLAAAFLLLSPRFFAEGHYNNKDVVLMSLALCTLWQALRLMKKPTFPAALLFALFGALAANTKLIGFALWGLCALFVLIRHISRKSLTPRVIGIGAVALVGFAAFYALLTPAMWQDPVEFMRYLLQNAMAFTRWENYVLFRGVVFDTGKAALPWYYLPYMILAATPLWLGLMIVVGQLAALPKMVKRGDDALPLALTTLLWALPLGFALITRTTVYNGWRHFYFLYGPMLILAAYGASRLWARLRQMKPTWLKRAFAVLMALCMLLTGVGIAINHPYQYAYYQPLIALRQGDWLELDYWNVSAQNALTELCGQVTGEIVIGYADIWSETGLRRGLAALPADVQQRVRVADDIQQARYMLVNPTYALLGGFMPTPDMTEAVVISAYGRDIMRIYSREAVQ